MRNRAGRSKWKGRKNGGAEPSPSTGGRGGNDRRDAKQTFERYMAMAKAAASSGDTVESEKYYQYADHFLRLMKAATH